MVKAIRHLQELPASPGGLLNCMTPRSCCSQLFSVSYLWARGPAHSLSLPFLPRAHKEAAPTFQWCLRTMAPKFHHNNLFYMQDLGLPSMLLWTVVHPSSVVHTVAKTFSAQTLVFQLLSLLCVCVFVCVLLLPPQEIRAPWVQNYTFHSLWHWTFHPPPLHTVCLLASLTSGWRGLIKNPAGIKRRKVLLPENEVRAPDTHTCILFNPLDLLFLCFKLTTLFSTILTCQIM
jgi:hypothetical protein